MVWSSPRKTIKNLIFPNALSITTKSETMKRIIILLISSLFLLQCTQQGNLSAERATSLETLAEKEYETTEGKMDDQSKDESTLGDDQQSAPPSKPTEKKVIKTGRIIIEVSNYLKERTAIDALIARHKGYIAKENEDRSSYRLSNTLVIRLQPEQLDSFVNALEPLALNIENKSIETKDITKQFIDLETRLKNKRAVVARYRDLLKKSHTVKEILAVEEELRKVTEEIESTEGQLKYLRDQVSLSTVYLTYYERIEQPHRKKKNFFARLGNSIADGWNGLQELVIGLVGLWHILLFLGLVIWGIARFWKRKKQKKVKPT